MALSSLAYNERPLLVILLCLFLVSHGIIFLVLGMEARGTIFPFGISNFFEQIENYILIDPGASPSDLITLSGLRIFGALGLIMLSRWGAFMAGGSFVVSIFFIFSHYTYNYYSLIIVAACMAILLLHFKEFE